MTLQVLQDAPRVDKREPKQVTFYITEEGVYINQELTPCTGKDLIEIASFCILLLEDVSGRNSVQIMDDIAGLVRRYHRNQLNG